MHQAWKHGFSNKYITRLIDQLTAIQYFRCSGQNTIFPYWQHNVNYYLDQKPSDDGLEQESVLCSQVAIGSKVASHAEKYYKIYSYGTYCIHLYSVEDECGKMFTFPYIAKVILYIHMYIHGLRSYIFLS